MQVFYCLIFVGVPRGIVGHGTYGARCPVSAKGSAQTQKNSPLDASRQNASVLLERSVQTF